MATERVNHNEAWADEDAQRKALKAFRDEGLLWMVNTAILHPRGFALGIQIDDDGEPVGLTIAQHTDDYWYFQPGEFDDVFANYEIAEAQRAFRMEEAAYERVSKIRREAALREQEEQDE